MVPPLSEVLGLVLQVDPRTLDRAAELGSVANWDSMQQVVLMSMIEQTYDVRFSAEEIAGATSVTMIEAALAHRGVAVTWASF